MVFLPLGGALRKWAYVSSVTTGHVSHCLNLCVFSGTTLWMGLSLCPRVTSARKIFPRNFVCFLLLCRPDLHTHFSLNRAWLVVYDERIQKLSSWNARGYLRVWNLAYPSWKPPNWSVFSQQEFQRTNPAVFQTDMHNESLGHMKHYVYLFMYIHALALYSTCDS